MEYLCTICCKRKRREPDPLPAIDRYISKRIQYVFAESKRLDLPFAILSGKYGLLDADDRIERYEHLLVPDDVATLAGRVVEQFAIRGATSVLFYARSPATDGWAPYYSVLEEACTQQQIPLRVRPLGPGYT
jgi:hypothetical protein